MIKKTDKLKKIYKEICEAVSNGPDEGTGDYGLIEDIMYADMVTLKKSMEDLFCLMGEDISW